MDKSEEKGLVDKMLQWVQPIITVVSLTFGCGILYADVQDIKKEVVEAKLDKNKIQHMEVRLAVSEDAQKRTVDVLEKVVLSVDKLNVTVAKLETKLER